MKLELKHIVGYLPYGLKMYWEDNENRPMDSWELKCESVYFVLNNQNKPILRPLSDLTKEIEVNGERFVPIDKINENGEYGLLIGSLEKICLDNLFWEDKCEMNMLNIFEINKLNNLFYEWHFDIHNLIENNLAIDKNTII